MLSYRYRFSRTICFYFNSSLPFSLLLFSPDSSPGVSRVLTRLGGIRQNYLYAFICTAQNTAKKIFSFRFIRVYVRLPSSHHTYHLLEFFVIFFYFPSLSLCYFFPSKHPKFGLAVLSGDDTLLHLFLPSLLQELVLADWIGICTQGWRLEWGVG